MGPRHPIERAARRPRSEARIERSPAMRKAAFVLVLLIAACTDPDFASLKGEWLGFFSLGTDTTGYNLMTIDGNNNCVLYAEINVSHRILGDYKLRVDGEPKIEYGRINGNVTLTRYWPGVDTLVATANWSGIFDRPSETATGVWETMPGSPFGGSGYWMSTRK